VLKNPKRIIKGLYLGSWQTAVRRATLKQVGITHIINTTQVPLNNFKKVKIYVKII